MRPTDEIPWAGMLGEGASREFAVYWQSLPRSALVPSRSSFRPEEIPKLLPQLVIHELVSPGFLRMRLVGTGVTGDYDQEITGRNYLDLVDEPLRAEASAAIFAACGHPAGLLVRLRSVARSGRVMTRESIGLPMRDDDGRVSRMYFCSSASGRQSFGFQEPEELRVIGFEDRRFLDIGAGVPDFEG